jgi:hypothetical protein
MIYNDVIKDIDKINCFIYAETTAYDPNGENEYIIEHDLDYNCRMIFLRLYKYSGGKVNLYEFIVYDVNKFSFLYEIDNKKSPLYKIILSKTKIGKLF